MNEIISTDNAINLVKTTELETQVTTAKSFPRNVEKCVDESIHMATFDKEIAESCNYSLPRRGKNGKTEYIKGASIRLAEIFAQAWGNLYCATRIVGKDEQFITAEAVAWDLEKNNKIITEVKRSIRGKNGMYSQDMQMITANAAASIALRNAIFRVIPKAYVDSVYKKAMDFAYQQTGKSLVSLIDGALTYFAKHNYNEKHVLTFLNKEDKAEIDRNDLEILGGIKNRIEDGILNAKDALPIENSDFYEQNSSKNELDTMLDKDDKNG